MVPMAEIVRVFVENAAINAFERAGSEAVELERNTKLKLSVPMSVSLFGLIVIVPRPSLPRK
jgi:hypothetical protein